MNNPLLKLLASNRQRGFVRAESGADAATVWLYDVIVDDALEAELWGGVVPSQLIEQIRAITAPVIHLRINSPGGSVFGARAIEQALREHPARVVAHVDGYAASAASFVAASCPQVIMAPGAMLMIHKAWTLGWGNADDLIHQASVLEKIDATLARTYAARAGGDAEQWLEAMALETWYTADEAVASGLADEIADAAHQTENRIDWDLSAFGKAPAAADPARLEPTPEPAEVQAATPRLDHLRRRLALVEKAA